MVILKMLVVILILLFPLGEMGRVNIYNEISTTVNDIVVGLLMTVWLTLTIFKNGFGEISKNKLFKPILFFVLVAFLSLILNSYNLNSSEFLASFLHLLRFVSYAAIYFIISGFDMKFKKKILILLIISGSMVVLGGFIQYFLYPSLRNLYYLGWDEHLYRLFSVFLDPNFASSIISLFLVLLLSLLLLGFSKSQKIKMILVLLSISAFIAILLTYSRSGYLMAITSISVLLFMTGRKRYITILLLFFIIGIVLIPKNLGGEGVDLLRTASIISRTDYVSNAITIFKDNPIFGIGFNTYRYTQHRYGFIDESSLRTSHAGAGTDNSFLFILATTGIVGFVFYLYMWFRILKGGHSQPASRLGGRGEQVQHDKREELFQKLISVVVVASSAGLFINALFLNSLFYPFVMEWMWILIGFKESS